MIFLVFLCEFLSAIVGFLYVSLFVFVCHRMCVIVSMIAYDYIYHHVCVIVYI